MTNLPDAAALALDQLAATAAANAATTDREGRFPAIVIDQFLASDLAGLASAAEHGGMGQGVRQTSAVVSRIAAECGSSAMIIAMHYSAVAVIEGFASAEIRAEVAAGRGLATLAFSEAGSRSHFWAPLSTARRDGGDVVLDARKSWATSANHARWYVWSSAGTEGEGASIWLVGRETQGIDTSAPFDGLGLRGNDSGPVSATAARIPAANLLGEDGKGGDIMLGVVLPVFAVLNASASLGLMDGLLARTIPHLAGTQYQHMDGAALSSFPTIRAYLAQMQVKTDLVRALLGDTITALENPCPATMLRVLEAKAAAGETATEVADLAMRVCGGMAFRKDVGVERLFRDARAATVMAPTTDQLYDFIGRALTGIDLFA